MSEQTILESPKTDQRRLRFPVYPEGDGFGNFNSALHPSDNKSSCHKQMRAGTPTGSMVARLYTMTEISQAHMPTADT